MKRFFLSLTLLGGLAVCAHAQEFNPLQYNRSSLHLVLLTTDEPTVGENNFSSDISKAWNEYPFPDKYDQIRIGFTEGYGGKPKGSMMELINKYRDGFGDLSVDELKSIMESLKNNKYYEQQLIDTTTVMLRERKIAQQLLRQWYNIKDDGTYDNSRLVEKSMYGASQADIAAATSTVRGKDAIVDKLSDNMIGNTFISFSKLAFYENEPVSAFTKTLAYAISAFLPGPAASIAQQSANVAYESTRKGYSAYTTTVLYKLAWNDSTMNMFYSTFEGDVINMEKFEALDFPFTLVGVQTATSSTVDALGGLGEMVGIDAGKPNGELIQQTIIRNIDKVFAKMQYAYDEFRPVVPIVSANPLLADIGMKEGIDDKSTFDLMEVTMDPATGEIEYKKVAVLKVEKGKVWDNRYVLADKKQDDDGQILGTELKANKKAVPGMLIKQNIKKK